MAIKNDLLYRVDDKPPWFISILLAVQHYIVAFGGTLVIPFIITPKLCMEDNDPARGYIVATIFFASGLITILQATVGVRNVLCELEIDELERQGHRAFPSELVTGRTRSVTPACLLGGGATVNLKGGPECLPTKDKPKNHYESRLALLPNDRLPILQGGTFTYLAPTIAMLSLPQWQCPAPEVIGNMTYEDKTELWQVRMRQVQGAIIFSSFFQVAIGFLGLVGLFLKILSPLVIVPAISLIGFSVFKAAGDQCGLHWGVSGMTIILMIMFSQYMRKISCPIPLWSKAKGWNILKLPVFDIFPVLFTMLFMWGICGILTAADVLPANSPIRTDTKLDAIYNSPWFRVPYPLQWGMPTVSAGDVIGLLTAILASILESVGDYYSCAKLAGAKPPPVHALNRGIGIEGLGCIIAGLWGTGNGTTSYSSNIAAIGITKVGSRRVITITGVLMLVLGVLPKLNAAFITIPEPIVGGVLVVMASIVTAVGLSPIQYIDLNCTRNLFVLGFSLFFAMVTSEWVAGSPELVKTGSDLADQTMYVILSTPMCVGSIVACFLDNTLPGTPESRGLTTWMSPSEDELALTDHSADTYDIPFITNYLKTKHWARYVPFLPTFQGWEDNLRPVSRIFRKRKNRDENPIKDVHFVTNL